MPTVNPSKHYIRELMRSVNSNTLVHPVYSSNFVHPADIHTADCNKPLHPVISSSRPVCPVNVCKTISPSNSNKIVCTVTSDKPINSNVVHPVNSSKTVYPVNASKLECLVDVCKSIRSFNSNKPGCPINSNTFVLSVNCSNFVHPVDIHTADYDKPLRSVINFSKPVHPVNVCKAICLLNSNKIARTFTSDKPINSVCLVNSSKTVCPVNSSKPEHPVDVCKTICSVNSNKSI